MPERCDGSMAVIATLWAHATVHQQQQPLETCWRLVAAVLASASSTICPFYQLRRDSVGCLCSDTCNGFAGVPLPGFKILDEQSRHEAEQRSVVDYIDVCLRQYSRSAAAARRYHAPPQQEANNTPTTTTAAASVGQHTDEMDHMKLEIEAQLEAIFGSPKPTNKETGGERSSGNNDNNKPLWAVRRASDYFVQLNDVQKRLLFVDELHLLQNRASDDLLSKEGSSRAADVHGSRFRLFTSNDKQGLHLDSTFLAASQYLQETLVVNHNTAAAGQQKAVESISSYNWVLSDVALSEFLWIMHTIAGPAEFRRALRLLDRMYVVFIDSASLYERKNGNSENRDLKRLEGAAIHFLNSSTKINERHKAVFGLGDILHAVTLTANKQFVQAAKDQGVEVDIVFHPSRALTERKRTGADHMGGPKKPPSLSMDDWARSTPATIASTRQED